MRQPRWILNSGSSIPRLIPHHLTTKMGTVAPAFHPVSPSTHTRRAGLGRVLGLSQKEQRLLLSIGPLLPASCLQKMSHQLKMLIRFRSSLQSLRQSPRAAFV